LDAHRGVEENVREGDVEGWKEPRRKDWRGEASDAEETALLKHLRPAGASIDVEVK